MRILFSILSIGSLIFFSCNNEKKDTTTTDTDTTRVVDDPVVRPAVNDTAWRASAQATLSATKADTALSGTAKFDTTAGGKVKLVLDITVASKANSTVAVHLHEHGDCGDNGEMAHGHWNPTNEEHGKWGSSKYHSGDIGNVKLDKDGKGTITVETDRWTLGGAGTKNILNKAVIVHSGVDDFKTQPTGNAGSRIGCGVIQ